MPTDLCAPRIERRPVYIPFTLIAVAMWALSLAVIVLDPIASSTIDSAFAVSGP